MLYIPKLIDYAGCTNAIVALFSAIIDEASTAPSSALTSNRRVEKGGQRAGAGAFPRRTDHQDPYAGRCSRPSAPLHRHRGAGQRHHLGPALLNGQSGDAVLADKAYDSNALRAIIAEIGAMAVIPSNRTRRIIIPHDADAYKQRNRIERCFCKLKHFRRLATHYDKRTGNFTGFIHLAAAIRPPNAGFLADIRKSLVTRECLVGPAGLEPATRPL